LRRLRIGKDQTGLGVPSRYAGDFLPTTNGDIDVERV
jgi:hypothetical protein